jgi:hypothetical protein
MKEHNIKNVVNIWARSWSEIKTEMLKNSWNKHISNEELEFEPEDTEEEDFHRAFGAGPSDVPDWLNEVEEDLRYQNLTEEETAQQAEEDGSSGEDGEGKKKEEMCAKFKFSEVKRNLDSIICFVDSNPQYN